MFTDYIFVSVCFGVLDYISIMDAMDIVDQNSHVLYTLLALILTTFCLPLATNLMVTTLIVGRIWYLSPRKACNIRSTQFPKGTGRAAIEIVIESGVLSLAVQLVFVILIIIGHPALSAVGAIAVQIYVSILSHIEGREFVVNQESLNITQGISAALIIIRVGLCVSNMQPGPIHSGPPLPVHPTPSTQVRINTELGHGLPTEMPVSEIKSMPRSEDLSSAPSSMERATTATV